jgi:hypothetical protein
MLVLGRNCSPWPWRSSQGSLYCGVCEKSHPGEEGCYIHVCNFLQAPFQKQGDESSSDLVDTQYVRVEVIFEVVPCIV